MNDDPQPQTAALPQPQRAGDWKAILRDLGVTPSRRMGQNFLVDRDVLAEIVATAAVQGGETVIEVGPGLGILTAALAEAVGPVGRVVGGRTRQAPRAVPPDRVRRRAAGDNRAAGHPARLAG